MGMLPEPEPGDPRLRALVEAYDKDLEELVLENRRLRQKLKLDIDTPVDWGSEDEEDLVEPEAESVPVRPALLPVAYVPVSPSHSSPRSPFTNVVSDKSSRQTAMSRQSSVNGPIHYTVSSKFASKQIEFRYPTQTQAVLLNDLRRWSEDQVIGDQLQSSRQRHSAFQRFPHSRRIESLLSTCRLPMSPNANVRLVWDMAGLILILYDVINIPLQVFNEPEDTFSMFMGWTSLLFWTWDMVMSNIVGYFDGPTLVMQQHKITLRYLRTWFVLDCIVVVPDWFTRFASDGGSGALASAGRILRSARAIRVVRLLRLLKLQKMLNKIYDFIDSEYMFIIMDVARLVSVVMVLNHVIACLWYYVGDLGYRAGERNWLQHTGMEEVIEREFIWKYTTALHWSLTQFTPAGMDVFAMNVPERVMSIIVLMFAIITFSSILASVSASMTALRSLQGDNKKQFWLLRRYLKAKKVRLGSRIRIIKYLEHQTYQQSLTVKESDVKLLPMLSEPLSNLLSYELKKCYAAKHHFFIFLETHLQFVLVRLCACAFKEVRLAADDIVFARGDVGENCFFLLSGSLHYSFPIHGKGLQTLKDLPRGSWFAESCLWTESWNHRGLLVAESPAEVAMVLPAMFASCMRLSESSYRVARRYAQRFVTGLNESQSPETGEYLTDIPWGAEVYNELIEDATREGDSDQEESFPALFESQESMAQCH